MITNLSFFFFNNKPLIKLTFVLINKYLKVINKLLVFIHIKKPNEGHFSHIVKTKINILVLRYLIIHT